MANSSRARSIGPQLFSQLSACTSTSVEESPAALTDTARPDQRRHDKSAGGGHHPHDGDTGDQAARLSRPTASPRLLEAGNLCAGRYLPDSAAQPCLRSADGRGSPMQFHSYVPGSPLREFVDDFWLYEDYAGEHLRERILPSGTFEVVFNLREDELRIYGPSDPAACRRFAGV